ncbi:16S rRNA (adenine(1518)-N(6)/adenine(1519)-N(6))-dimethyltransferase RsmA [Metamycoplasma neophronis]|uniref:Ribosomal RNA small subunit methyltransferase A n=1 Tax=Metamycoplasma neophronis TaxID=872983 RepID=A0ABY2Z1A7_9BACT|nr:16S rRNA (adenine(1518)-N(6)/adenine(1519)-N(6))-dimethyltransferase RsmA [Metamycoplasma neophronis]TPR54704.1 ribosomal RNA small subunit methyltransferase A [Metamycoplasma neophronis]
MEYKAKKSFGQNFLINKGIQKKIIEGAEIHNEVTLEIGPGLGALTYLMIPHVKELYAYELDKELYDRFILENHPQNIHFINKDFLLENFENFNDNEIVVVGNIPYNITSDILFNLLKYSNKIKRATLMMQKEVCLRLLAKPNTKEYGKLTVSMNIFANISKVVEAKAREFNPAPKVDSMVVRIDFIKANNWLEANKKQVLDFILRCFQFKRKTLYNNLITKYSKEQILQAFETLNIPNNIRAEALEKEVFIELFKALK